MTQRASEPEGPRFRYNAALAQTIEQHWQKTWDEQGTFWAQEDRSWLWYNDTIESHAFALRTVMELTPEEPKKDGLVQWILLNKKLNQWKSTRATAEVIYSLLHYLKKEGAPGIREDATVTIGSQKVQFVFEPDSYTGKKNQIVVEVKACGVCASELHPWQDGGWGLPTRFGHVPGWIVRAGGAGGGLTGRATGP